jgi:hypothetical protein
MMREVKRREFDNGIIVNREGKVIHNAFQQDDPVIIVHYDDGRMEALRKSTGKTLFGPYFPDEFYVPDLQERLAAYAHSAWSGWMEYMFSKCAGPTPDSVLGRPRKGSFILPPDLVERWQRQMRTEYKDLPEEEKRSDRDEAQKMIDIMRGDNL